MRRAGALALIGLLPAMGCATSSAFRAGEKAERHQDFDQAVLEYAKALKQNPANLTYQKSLARARLRAAHDHASGGRRLAVRGLFKEAIDEYRLALDLNPDSADLRAEAHEVEARLKASSAGPLVDAPKARPRERGLPGLDLPPEADQPLGLHFRGASLREAYEALGKATGVNFVFDAQFQDQTITLDLRNVPLDQALQALAGVGRTFHRVLDSRVVSVIPDTPQKRREYEQQVVRTFFLGNAEVKETLDLVRIVLGARRVAALPGANAITISDTPEKVAAAERLIAILDKKRAEVVVEVEILEVNRGRLREYGIELTSSSTGTGGVVFGLFPNPLGTITAEESPYRKSNLVITGLPGVIARLLHTDSSSRLLANPQLRASEGQTAQARFGDQVPVPVTTFTPIAQGGISQQPITSFEYKNVGVNIDITPRVHHDGEVTLTLKLDISSVGAPGYQGVPTFNSRQVTSVIRLKDGETNLIAGLISDSERQSLNGLPGIANLPLVGRLFGHSKSETNESDIVMTLTPHVVRRPELTEEDLRAFLVGSETSPLMMDIPSVAPIPGITPIRPSPEPPRVEPIRPPSSSPTPTPPPGNDR